MTDTKALDLVKAFFVLCRTQMYSRFQCKQYIFIICHPLRMEFMWLCIKRSTLSAVHVLTNLMKICHLFYHENCDKCVIVFSINF